MKIKVNAEEKIVNVVEYKYPGAKKSPAEYPLHLKALYPIRYYHERPPFSIIGLITGNPMIAIMVFSLGVMAIFPKLLQGIDPEEMKQMQEEMNISADPYTELKKMAGLGGGGQEAKTDR
jgi:ER membrane protein complex subunit 7